MKYLFLILLTALPICAMESKKENLKRAVLVAHTFTISNSLKCTPAYPMSLIILGGVVTADYAMRHYMDKDLKGSKRKRKSV